MNVLVVGGRGKIGLRLLRLLAARGDVARGMIRKPEQAGELEAAGAQPVICDIEAVGEISEQVEGSDAVVFAAGAGPGSGPERKRTVDLGGATKLIDACKATGVRRYVMVSAIGVSRPGSISAEMKPYYDAKTEADEALVASGLDYTIVRPGRLTDDPGTGLVRVGTPLDEGRRGHPRRRRRDPRRGARRATQHRARLRPDQRRDRDRRRARLAALAARSVSAATAAVLTARITAVISRRIGVLFMIGSACFAVASIPGLSDLVPGAVGVTYFVGSIFFTSAAFEQMHSTQPGDRREALAGPAKVLTLKTWSARSPSASRRSRPTSSPTPAICSTPRWRTR